MDVPCVPVVLVWWFTRHWYKTSNPSRRIRADLLLSLVLSPLAAAAAAATQICDDDEMEIAIHIATANWNLFDCHLKLSAAAAATQICEDGR